MKNAVYLLFPYPVMICAENYQFSSAEKKFISELEMVNNTGNLMSKNEKILHSKELANLKSFIERQIIIYTKNLLRMKDENNIYITQSWANFSEPEQFHPKHKHPNSVVSGVLFFDENSDGSLPPIRFHRTLEMFPLEFEFADLNESNSDCRSFATEQGSLILFPSLLEHDVAKNKSDRARTSISFNTFVRGAIGRREKLTEVDIS
jgi:uncharacterized protein (TIGR02466 family)